jgi:hypothetical protein
MDDELQFVTPEKAPPVWCAAFFAALAETGNASEACRAAKISRMTVWRHRDNDPVFRARWADAMEEAADNLETEARRRAKVGSDTLLIFLLKGARPEKYRERYEAQHTGPQGGAIQHEVSVDVPRLSPSALADFAADVASAGLGHLLSHRNGEQVDSPPTPPEAAAIPPPRPHP